jgi:hypothetical protein
VQIRHHLHLRTRVSYTARSYEYGNSDIVTVCFLLYAGSTVRLLFGLAGAQLFVCMMRDLSWHCVRVVL